MNQSVSGSDSPRRIRLLYEGASKNEHTLPADVLVKSLRQVQRIVYLLAKLHRGDELGQRTRASHDLERRFALMCQMPEAGSYALPVEIGNPSMQGLFDFDDEAIMQVSRTFHQVSQAMNRGDLDALRSQVPDSAYRKSLIESYKGAQPPQRLGVVLSIEDREHNKLLDGFGFADALAELDRRLTESDDQNTPAYVTGTLVRMHFEERRLQLKLLNGRAFQATYSDDFEPDLLDHPRDLIQLHGDVTYDEHGMPTTLTEVDRIVEIDESSIKIGELTLGDLHYRADPPLHFEVVFDREDHLYDLKGEFGITLWAEARPELEDALYETLAMLWAEYVQDESSRLSPGALKLQAELRRRIQDISHGV